jgi:hypothetical protein
MYTAFRYFLQWEVCWWFNAVSSLKNVFISAGHLWLRPVILPTQEAEIRRIVVSLKLAKAK